MASPTETEIQFLGNWNSQQPASSTSLVSAIVLTYTTTNLSTMENSMTFSRDTTPVVHVGRSTVDTADALLNTAAFDSPVVSRNHAKITFADGGSVFIIDTNSLHGTWLTRSGDPVKLIPESPRQLQDGDKITFGKEVVKDGIPHQSVCVTVKLLHSISAPPISMSNESASPDLPVLPKPIKRFGLQPSSESENSDKESENGSYSIESQEIRAQDNPISFELASLSPCFETRQPLFSPVSPFESSGSSSADDMEPISEVTPHDAPPTPEACLAFLGTPPWRHPPSNIWGRLPMAKQISSPPSRFEQLFGAHSRVEANPSLTEPTDRHYSYHSGRHFFHHQGHHHHHEKESNDETTLKLSQRLRALSKEIDNLKAKHVHLPMLRDMTASVASDTETLLAANLQKVRETVNLLQSDMVVMKSHKNGIQTDIRFLRADHEARGEELKDMKVCHDTDITELRESVKTLERCLVDAKSDLVSAMSGLKASLSTIQSDINHLRELQKAQSDTAQLIESSLLRVEEMNDLRAAQAFGGKMSEEIKGEMGEMLDQYCTTTPVLGKRKRDDDDVTEGAELANSIPVVPQMKRSRLVTKIATASVIGAMGAWLGLAFL